ncbi:uncharacterized protein LOC131690811 [Topomyia yanbarensis]|uniref:uncharacterized protein LOC131690811 n=1 Tax=Topomyia yanbarensis TaxID=2498891 RepID=UPI00273C332F|nr:uncharacterized protein LOC131690811 [Topomyia yanbarensis]
MARNKKLRRSVGLRKTPRKSVGRASRVQKVRLPEMRENNRRQDKPRDQFKVRQQKLLRRALMKEKRNKENSNRSPSRPIILYPPIPPPPPPSHVSGSSPSRRVTRRRAFRRFVKQTTASSDPIVIDSEDDSGPQEPPPLFYVDTTGGFNDKEVPKYGEDDGDQDDESVMLLESTLEEGEIKDESSVHGRLNGRINAEEIPISDDDVDCDDDPVPLPRKASTEVIFCSEVIDLDREVRREPALDFIPIGYDLGGWKRKKQSPRNKTQKHAAGDKLTTDTNDDTENKRMVIIDGNNVAFAHTCGQTFSVKGLEICIEYFKKMGHEVKAVVPQFRLKKDKSTDQKLLEDMYKNGDILLAPSKNLPGQRSSSYDDRLIISVTEKFDGVIISNDNFRDLLAENDSWKKIIETRVIGYTWAKDAFFLPDDPYGRHGPKLKELLACGKEVAATPKE